MSAMSGYGIERKPSHPFEILSGTCMGNREGVLWDSNTTEIEPADLQNKKLI
jgi:hypothetical protein